MEYIAYHVYFFLSIIRVPVLGRGVYPESGSHFQEISWANQLENFQHLLNENKFIDAKFYFFNNQSYVSYFEK